MALFLILLLYYCRKALVEFSRFFFPNDSDCQLNYFTSENLTFGKNRQHFHYQICTKRQTPEQILGFCSGHIFTCSFRSFSDVIVLPRNGAPTIILNRINSNENMSLFALRSSPDRISLTFNSEATPRGVAGFSRTSSQLRPTLQFEFDNIPRKEHCLASGRRGPIRTCAEISSQ
jgi:hypothetical protein